MAISSIHHFPNLLARMDHHNYHFWLQKLLQNEVLLATRDCLPNHNMVPLCKFCPRRLECPGPSSRFYYDHHVPFVAPYQCDQRDQAASPDWRDIQGLFHSLPEPPSCHLYHLLRLWCRRWPVRRWQDCKQRHSLHERPCPSWQLRSDEHERPHCQLYHPLRPDGGQ